MAITLKERVKQLQKARPEVERRIVKACKDATMRAVETATEKTTVGLEKPLAGTNAVSSNMKDSWDSSSETTPQKNGNAYTTILANNQNYASFVNDGHRMDRHFVPGLAINPYSGMLEINLGKQVGIVVGTKTKYVPGVHMVDDAKETYRQVLEKELSDIGEIFE